MIASAVSINFIFKILGGIHEEVIKSTCNAIMWNYIIKKKQVIDQKHFLSIVSKISCKKLVLYITVKLDFNIDRKSANFDLKNPQNISLDQIITEFSTFSFHY